MLAQTQKPARERASSIGEQFSYNLVTAATKMTYAGVSESKPMRRSHKRRPTHLPPRRRGVAGVNGGDTLCQVPKCKRDALKKGGR